MRKDDLREVAKGFAAALIFLAVASLAYPATVALGAIICAAQTLMGGC